MMMDECLKEEDKIASNEIGWGIGSFWEVMWNNIQVCLWNIAHFILHYVLSEDFNELYQKVLPEVRMILLSMRNYY